MDMGVVEKAPVPSWLFSAMGPPTGAASAVAERLVAEGLLFRVMGASLSEKG
jgi:hypothetical protein